MNGRTGTSPGHILMTADTVGGVWTYAMDLCAELATYGIRVSLATMGEPMRPHQRMQAASIPHLDVYESTFRLEWMEDPWGDVDAAGDWLLELQRRTGADTVHLNGYVHAALPWRVPVVVVAHSCVLSWWRAVKGEDAPDRLQTYRQRVARGVREADAVVAPSAWMLDQVRLHYGLPQPGVVIPNARGPLFTPAAKRDFVFSCGRIWDQAKNIGCLCGAAPLLKWPVAIAGDLKHPDGGSLLLSHVRLLGALEQRQVAEWMAMAGIYALPAHYEPFGLSALEAALSGCALVLGRIGSLQEIWGDSALYVSPDDPGELVAAVNGLVGNAELRKMLSERARRHALTYTTERMAAGYLDAYALAQRRCEQKSAAGLLLEKSCA